MKNPILLFLILVTAISCQNKQQKEVAKLISEWQNKEIIFPEHSVFTYYGEDTTLYAPRQSDYKILVYIDSVGCTHCKLGLMQWRDFMKFTDSSDKHSVSYFFYLYYNNYEKVKYILKRDQFDFPICFDREDELNKLNNFPKDIAFQTFLLDRNNRVKVIGNPILNPQIKDLYLKIITNDTTQTNVATTTTMLNTQRIDLGHFPIGEVRDTVFTITNTGSRPLIIKDILTSCGCISTSYDRTPVMNNKKLDIRVKIEPDTPGFFEKTITVYCNTDHSPIELKIKGLAQSSN